MKERKEKNIDVLEQVKDRIREMYLTCARAVIDGKNLFVNKERMNTLEYVIREIEKIEGEMDENQNI